jgi:hypothetical protein
MNYGAAFCHVTMELRYRHDSYIEMKSKLCHITCLGSVGSNRKPAAKF